MRSRPEADDLQVIWNAALKAQLGVVICTNDRRLLRQQLYMCRKAMGDEKLNSFSLHTPETPNELWIVNREVAHEQLR